MIARPNLRAVWNRSRTRDAPTPTNISMKSEPVTDRNGTPASPATARARSVLPVPGGPTRRTALGRGGQPPALGDARADFLEARRLFQEVDDLVDLLLDPAVAGHVVERRARP